MADCDHCKNLEKELAEVKQELRRLESSEARGYEYTAEHEKLEQRRNSLVSLLSSHKASHATA